LKDEMHSINSPLWIACGVVVHQIRGYPPFIDGFFQFFLVCGRVMIHHFPSGHEGQFSSPQKPEV
jgi:hypothetical protein